MPKLRGQNERLFDTFIGDITTRLPATGSPTSASKSAEATKSPTTKRSKKKKKGSSKRASPTRRSTAAAATRRSTAAAVATKKPKRLDAGLLGELLDELEEDETAARKEMDSRASLRLNRGLSASVSAVEIIGKDKAALGLFNQLRASSPRHYGKPGHAAAVASPPPPVLPAAAAAAQEKAGPEGETSMEDTEAAEDADADADVDPDADADAEAEEEEEDLDSGEDEDAASHGGAHGAPAAAAAVLTAAEVDAAAAAAMRAEVVGNAALLAEAARRSTVAHTRTSFHALEGALAAAGVDFSAPGAVVLPLSATSSPVLLPLELYEDASIERHVELARWVLAIRLCASAAAAAAAASAAAPAAGEQDAPPTLEVEASEEATPLAEAEVFAKALFVRSDGSGRWVQCTVVAIDETARPASRCSVRWRDGTIERVPRIYLHLGTDSAAQTAKRIAAALARRTVAFQLLRRQLMVECIPTHAFPSVSDIQTERIARALVTTPKSVLATILPHDDAARVVDPRVAKLIYEASSARHDFIGECGFDERLRSGALGPKLEDMRRILAPPPPPPLADTLIMKVWHHDKEARAAADVAAAYGLEHSLKTHTFAAQLRRLGEVSLLRKPETAIAFSGIPRVCEAGIKGLCDAIVTETPLYCVDFGVETVTFPAFEEIQAKALEAADAKLRSDWFASIQRAVSHVLRPLADGWFRLEGSECTLEIFRTTPLRRFFRQVEFMMQTALRTLMLEQIDSYATFWRETCEHQRHLFELTIRYNSTEPVKAVIEEGDWRAEAEKEAAAAAKAGKKKGGSHGKKEDVVVVEEEPWLGAIELDMDPQSLIDHIVASLDAPMHAFGDITTVQRRVLRRLYWNEETPSFLSSIKLTDPHLCECREELRHELVTAVGPLQDHVDSFSKYLPFLALDAAKMARELEAEYAPDEEDADGEFDIDAFHATVQSTLAQHKAQIAKLMAEIPDELPLGLFVLNTAALRIQMVEKYHVLDNLILEVLATRATDEASSIIADYDEIVGKIEYNCETIEELREQEEFVNQSKNSVTELVARGEALMTCYETLDGMKHQMAFQKWVLRWGVAAGEGRVDRAIEASIERNNALREMFATRNMTKKELFLKKIDALDAKVQSLRDFDEKDQTAEAAAFVREIRISLDEVKAEGLDINNKEGLFDERPTDYPTIAAIEKAFIPFHSLWDTLDLWQVRSKEWCEGNMDDIDADAMEKNVSEWQRNLNKRAKFFANQGKRFAKISALAKATQNEVIAFKPKASLILSLRVPGMRQRHWDKLAEVTGRPVVKEELVLNVCVDWGFLESVETIEKVAEQASKEYSLEMSLNEMEEQWQDLHLVLAPYGDTGTCILKEIDPIIALLDEQITMTQAMVFNAFKKFFSERIDKWDHCLSTMSEVIEKWLEVQRSYLSLQPVFDSDDIKKQLPAEAKRFAAVDTQWRYMIKQALRDPSPVSFCNDETLFDRLTKSNSLLNIVQKGLNDYLETKRGGFARFYFLSNEELLEILSETKDPTKVQPHLKKCFEAVKKVAFNEAKEILQMSDGKEKVELVSKVITKNINVENWMTDLEAAMREAVRHEMFGAIADYTNDPDWRCIWMLKWPAMCALQGSQAHFTRSMEAALDENGYQGLCDQLVLQEAQLLAMVTSVKQPGLSKSQITTIGAMAVMDVHAKDIATRMKLRDVHDKQDFEWIKELRYYWEIPEDQVGEDEPGDLFGQMLSSHRPYGYEYLGNSFRLVITPLTDKCYLTLTGALQMQLGGAPAGPAGTGKTETTKDLAKALAKQCVVFNCSDGMDYKMTAKFFKGLAACGAWCCFDEFNRILIEVLSVIAQQIKSLQEAAKRAVGDRTISFEGSEITVNPQFAVFITMNPGYAGRSALPDNLQALFRPVAMMVPDYALIGEIMLFAYGFEAGRAVAQKMVATFCLCSEQLSAQDHYDYGMRAVKTVIVTAGNLKQRERDADEDLLMLRALMDVNLPKFLAHDLPLFRGIMSDLFPGKSKPVIDYGLLFRSIAHSIEVLGLQPHPWFVEKVIQLYEMIVVRHGLMIVGPTMGGKTSNWKVLQQALTRLKEVGQKSGEAPERYETVVVSYINPKSITMEQLYGSFDPNTHEWHDGVLANLIRICSKNTSDNLQWVLFDGPVDTLWIESMNTVLDDNKKLCLNSGEIVPLSAPMTMMFEPKDLSVASPATVSRCGMVYMEPTSLGYDVIVDSWLDALPPLVLTATSGPRVELKRLCDTYIADSIGFLRRHITEPLPSVNNGLVNSLLKLFSCFLQPFYGPFDGGVKPKPTAGDVRDFCENIESQFLFCLVWSIMATADAAGRRKFDKFLRNLSLSNGVKVFFPERGLIYDYTFDPDASEWVTWESLMEVYHHDPKASFAEMIIPTMDTVRYTYLLKTLVENKMHVLMTGPTGTGKTVNVNRWLSRGAPKHFVPLTFTFSAQTSANMTQDVIDGKCEKRRKGVYGPMAGQQFVLFIDDINMPMREEYGAQPPIELLRQWICASGWYDLEEKSHPWRTIIDTVMVAACGPPGGGKQPVTDRFFRHFNIVGYTEMSDEVMGGIYSTILGEFLKAGFADECIKLTACLVEASIIVFNRIGKELLPTPAKSHYTFNLRDLGKVFQGILMTVGASIKTGADLARLWVHESRRVYQDRLINHEDTKWFDDICEELVESKMPGLDWSDVMPQREALIFCDFLQPGADPLVYEEATDIEKVFARIDEELVEYNAEMDMQMHLVMFIDAIKHVSRISRVIRQPQGNALLLGVGGSGRQSLTRLAAYVAKFECRQVAITKGYGKEQWREDLKEALMNAGVGNKPTVFLFVDTQIVFEGMLEDVNNVLNAGDVPNLYEPEDEDAIINTCRADCVKKRLLPTKLNIFSQYITRVRKNIHMVLAMSPVGDSFNNRIRKFPSLVNCCTIDWFFAWPDDALRSVAKQKIADADLDLLGADEKVIDLFCEVHQSVYRESDRYRIEAKRYNYVTPTSYLQLLSTYQEQLQIKRDDVGTKKMRLEGGYNKIVSTEDMVGGLKETLIKMQPQLKATQAEVDAMIIKIKAETTEATATKEKVQVAEASATEKASAASAIASSAQADLDKALPALDEAVKCLSLLEKGDIDEMRSFKIAPYGVRLSMEVACLMFHVKAKMVKDPASGKKTKDWFGAAKQKLLADSNKFKRMLIDYDKDNMAEDIVKKLAKYIEMDAFTPANVKKASIACEAVCKWAHAMYTYHCVAKEVEPKRRALAGAQAELQEVMIILEDAKGKLNAVESRIAELESTYQASLQKKDRLAMEVTQTTTRLSNAGKLITSLGSEKVRWKVTVGHLIEEYDNLVGDVIIAAGTIAYLGPFTPAFRQEIVAGWRAKSKSIGLMTSKSCDIIATLAKPVVVQQWQVLGLPSDNHSVENAVSMECASRWTLCIDPQGQANAFVKALGESKNGAGRMGVVTNRNKTVLVRTIENSIRNGTWVLLEDIEESLDAAIEPVLQRSTFKEKGQLMIKIGDNNVPYNESFRFFMTTKLPNPHYPPEVCVKVTLLNFTITPKGLEEQLLGVVTREEMPELEEKKTELTHNNAAMNANLDHLETETLRLLAASGDDILDNVQLISTLQESKTKSDEIAIAMADAKVVEEEIDIARERFRSVATRGSVLYFTIAELFRVCDMYQYSLQWFVEAVFVSTLRKSEQSSDVEVRKATLIEAVTYSLYDNICRSVFVRHKLLLSFMMTANIMEDAGTLDLAVWRFITSGQVAPSEDASVAPDAVNPEDDWLEEQAWQEIKQIDSLPQFKGLASDFCKHLPEWRGYYESAEPQTMTLPGGDAEGVGWDTRAALDKLCLLRALRPEKVMDGVQLFVIGAIGARYVDPPPFNLSISYEASTKMIPLIFVLTSGSDPGEELLEFAKKKHMDDKILKLSLGQGQDKVAEGYIEKGVRDGNWVYLQNCHLYASWMPSLARIAGNFKPDDINDDFRLWLSSMPSPVFPVSVLQSGLKITMEPPKGLRSNLLNAYSKLDDEMLERTDKPFEYKKLLFALSFFHAIVQARRGYGSLGWNRPYGFNNTDLSISKSQAELYIDLYPEAVPYKVLIFLTSYINYGGRVTDYIDLRTIDVIMREIFKPEVLTDTFTFSDSGIYYSCPVAEDDCHANYMEYISSLPLNPSPEAFGMHDNADITCARNETYELFETILTLQAGGGGGGGMSSDDILLQMCGGFMEKMPIPFDIEQVSSLYPLMYTESMNTVLSQECLRYNKLVREIRRTLPQLERAVKGLVVMSGELETMANALLVQGVPELWENKAYPCLKALNGWVDELLERLTFVQKWIDEGTPSVFWIAGFYFPQAFLTGSRQNYARKTTFPIDEVRACILCVCVCVLCVLQQQKHFPFFFGCRRARSHLRTYVHLPILSLSPSSFPAPCSFLSLSPQIEFEFVVQREAWQSVEDGPENGVYIRGLFIEGARWNAEIQSMDDSLPKKLFVEAPMLWCKPVRNYVKPTSGVYRMPVYKILSRWGILATTGHSSNFIMWIEMPSNRGNFLNDGGFADQKEWIKAGVASFCSLRH